MKGVEMHYTVQTLWKLGKSKSQIARELRIDRKTVQKIIKLIEGNNGEVKPVKTEKPSIMDEYRDYVLELFNDGLNAWLIYKRLVEEKGVVFSYSTVKRYVRSLKSSEVFVPQNTPPGLEAQVDFGHVGMFKKDGRMTKTYAFSMVLGNSRYAYYELVTNQSVETFIGCHINAFEFFGGVTQTVKLDNLKAGVLEASIYEPIFQKEYHEFLTHYGSSGITCRIRRGSDKGKVEAGIKFVKGNFIRGLKTRDYYEAVDLLKQWNANECNGRVHGTTRRVPREAFADVEKAVLKPLPAARYEIYRIENRKVNSYGHVAFRHNFYSVPHKYAGMEVSIKFNGRVIRIYKDFDEIALHPLMEEKGHFVTNEEHKSPYKQAKPEGYHESRCDKIGENAGKFLEHLKEHNPHSWHKMAMGIYRLSEIHGRDAVDSACGRAMEYGMLRYRDIKRICEGGLFKNEPMFIT
ncbi:MAG TPA: IS21 family transposase, partial [Candidatus Wallbacteria bacterium]|nr:IS21 family transposase [Candidatus Wallbacteria bacterium]